MISDVDVKRVEFEQVWVRRHTQMGLCLQLRQLERDANEVLQRAGVWDEEVRAAALSGCDFDMDPAGAGGLSHLPNKVRAQEIINCTDTYCRYSFEHTTSTRTIDHLKVL